jgi:hypothetical protein
MEKVSCSTLNWQAGALSFSRAETLRPFRWNVQLVPLFNSGDDRLHRSKGHPMRKTFFLIAITGPCAII